MLLWRDGECSGEVVCVSVIDETNIRQQVDSIMMGVKPAFQPNQYTVRFVPVLPFNNAT